MTLDVACRQGEHIVQRIVPIAELYDVLKKYGTKEGFTVDARLSHLVNSCSLTLFRASVQISNPSSFETSQAYGLSLTKSLGL